MATCSGTATIKRKKPAKPGESGAVEDANLHCPTVGCGAPKSCFKWTRSISGSGSDGAEVLEYEVQFCACVDAADYAPGATPPNPPTGCTLQLFRVYKRPKKKDDEIEPPRELVDAYAYCDGNCDSTNEECPPIPSPSKTTTNPDGSTTDEYVCNCAAKGK